MNRREFLVLLGGTAAAWPLAGRAQQAAMARMVSYGRRPLLPHRPRMEWFTQALPQLGFTEGRNLAIELRMGCA